MSKIRLGTLHSRSARFGWLDTARGMAVIAMTIFHFTWDLEFLGYAPQGLTMEPGWRWFARGIAASFLLLVGFSFVLAHRNGFRFRPFWKRFAQVLCAALIITVSTWFATPDRFVFFGILHQIAFASLVAALVLPLPWPGLAVAAAAIFTINSMWTSEVFNTPLLWWVGLAPFDPPTNDYVPMFPWTGWVLAGMTAAKLYLEKGQPKAGAETRPAKLISGIRFLGRHSLIYYLVHQPVMIGLLTAFSWIVPPAAPDLAANFDRACIKGCQPVQDQAYCERFCACVAGSLTQQSIFEPVARGEIGVDDARVAQAAQTCTAKTDAGN